MRATISTMPVSVEELRPAAGVVPRPSWLRRVPLALLVWLAVSVIFSAVQSTTALELEKPFFAALLLNCVHLGLWALLWPVLSRVVERFPLQKGEVIGNGIVLLAFSFAAAGAVAIMLVSLLYAMLVVFGALPFPVPSPLPTYWGALGLAVKKTLQTDVLTCVVLISSLHAWRWRRALETEQLHSAELEGRLARTELNALRMQLHPHFLFNTLHSIAGLVTEDPFTARRMIVTLGDFLRLTLEERAVLVRPLRDELEFISLYTGIEKMRFGDRVSFEYDTGPGTDDAMVPYLILQPLVENAVRHGVARIRRPATITLRTQQSGGNLRIVLENDGPQRPADTKFGLGLSNTLDRLRLHYGDRFHFALEDRPEGGCVATLVIPYETTDVSEEVHAGGDRLRLPRSAR